MKEPIVYFSAGAVFMAGFAFAAFSHDRKTINKLKRKVAVYEEYIMQLTDGLTDVDEALSENNPEAREEFADIMNERLEFFKAVYPSFL